MLAGGLQACPWPAPRSRPQIVVCCCSQDGNLSAQSNGSIDSLTTEQSGLGVERRKSADLQDDKLQM